MTKVQIIRESMDLDGATDTQLKLLYRQAGGKGGNIKRETLIKRIQEMMATTLPCEVKQAEKPSNAEISPLPDRVMPPLRVSVLPDEPLPANALNATIGMIAAAPVVRQVAGSLTEQQIMDATVRHRQQGMHVDFREGCWEFYVFNQQGRKGRMDSGNMSVPMKVIQERADFVAMGRPLPVVNPVIVPTVVPAQSMAQ